MRRTLVSICVLQAFSVPSWAEQASTDKTTLELQATDIVGTSDYETAQGPVEGYRATRSASATRTDTAIHETPQSISVVTKDVVTDIEATRLQDALDYAGGVGRANNFGGQGLTTFTVRGFTTGEFYRNGFTLGERSQHASRCQHPVPGPGQRGIDGLAPGQPQRARGHAAGAYRSAHLSGPHGGR